MATRFELSGAGLASRARRLLQLHLLACSLTELFACASSAWMGDTFSSSNAAMATNVEKTATAAAGEESEEKTFVCAVSTGS